MSSLDPQDEALSPFSEVGRTGAEVVQSQRLAIQLEVSRVIAAGGKPAETIPRILSAVCSGLGWAAGAFWSVSLQANVLRCEAFWHSSDFACPHFEAETWGSQFAQGMGLPGRVWRWGEPEWIPDVLVDDNFPRQRSAQRDGLHGGFACPVRVDSEICGVLEFFSRERQDRDEPLLKVICFASRELGHLLKRTWSEGAVQESERRYAAIVDASLDAIVSVDTDGCVRDFNAAAERTFGYARSEILGREFAELLAVERDRLLVRRALRSAFDRRDDVALIRRQRLRAQRANGDPFPIELTVVRIGFRGSPLVTGFVRDLTEPVRLEALTSTQKLMLQKIASGDAIEPILERAAATLSEQLGTLSSVVFGWDEVQQAHTSVVFSRPASELSELARRFPVKVQPEQLAELGLSHGVVCVSGRLAELDWGWREVARGWSHGSWWAAPMVSHRSRSVGALIIMDRFDGLIADHDRRLVSGLAQVATFAIEQREAEERRQQIEAHRAVLADAGVLLAYVLDAKATLGALTRFAVPRLADWCVAHVKTQDAIEQLAVSHVRPELEARLRVLDQSALDACEPHWGLEVLRTNRGLMVHRAEPASFAPGNRCMQLLDELGSATVIAVPLSARGHTLGALTLGVGQQGRLDGATLAMVEDLGRRAGLAVENALLYAQLQDAVRVRDDFLSIASHELKTPLTALNLQIQLMQTRLEQLGADARAMPFKQKMGTIRREVRRMARLIDQLLDISQLTANRLELQLEPLELGQVLREVVSRSREELEKSGCSVSLDLRGPVRGRWDRGRLEQVFVNLLSNAMKYGSGQSIEVSLKTEDCRAMISFRDHGIGIDPKDHERIFDRFERAASKRNYGGFGLGLWIVRRVLNAMGATIAVESERGEGSTFTVTLDGVI